MEQQTPSSETLSMDDERHGPMSSTPSSTLLDVSGISTPAIRDGDQSRRTPLKDVWTPKLEFEKSERINEDELYEVTLEGSEDPQNFPKLQKWIIVLTICTAAICVTADSSVAMFTYEGMEQELGASPEVSILTISLFMEGIGIGPLFLGPLSEFYGRNEVYWSSYICFFLLQFPVGFANNLPVLLIFRFLTGVSGSAFLSVAGGSISDLFKNREVGDPMAIYTAAPFLGPIVGPILSGFINQYVNWRWTYHVMTIWTFVEIILLLVLVPETYEPVLVKRKARRLRKETGIPKYWAPLDRNSKSIMRTIEISCYKPFELLLFEPMATLLTIWTALLLGILYLFFNAFPIVFRDGHGFSYQSTGLAFLGIGVGMVFGTASHFFWWGNIEAREWVRHGGPPPPETHLYVGMAGAIAVPISLFWFAFTTSPSVHWIVPIIGSIPFGTGIIWVYTSVLTFLVTTYRPVAASALASNAFVRFPFSAVFPLFSPYLYARLGTVGATALLAGLTVLMAPLPFIFYKLGPRLRQKSRFSSK